MMPFYAQQPVQHTIHQTVNNYNDKISHNYTESYIKKESVLIDQKQFKDEIVEGVVDSLTPYLASIKHQLTTI